MMSGTANWLQLSLMDVTYPASMRSFTIFSLLLLAACHSDIYTRDGVTDGDTFYLAPGAFSDNGAVFQSWVAYSLMKSACQLEIGGDNPARVNSFECEHKSRRRLINAWEEKRQQDQSVTDLYLDALSDVHDAGFLAEYTARYFGKRDWVLPDGLRSDAFQGWQREHLRRHRPVTRIIGSWNYKPGTT